MSEKVSKSERPSEGEWLDQRGRLRPETAIPGFWDTLVQDCSQWAKVTTVGPFWSEAEKLLPSWAGGYHAKYDYSLLTKPGLPNFIGKKVDPIRSKILNDYPGKGPPAPFPKGPPVPQLPDPVRTRIHCRYLDGVSFQAEKVLEKDPRFISIQPRHMIHLAHGLLVELRDTSRTEDTIVRKDETIRQSLQRKYIIHGLLHDSHVIKDRTLMRTFRDEGHK